MNTPSLESEKIQIRDLVPAGASPQMRRWYTAHQAHAQAWIRQEVQRGLSDVALAENAAWTLLWVPDERGVGHVPGEPIREPYCWDEIEAYEILFQYVVHGGLWDGWDPGEYLRLIGSFAKYLGERGVIPRAEHVALQVEYDLWAQRLLQVWDQGGWYERDGTYQSPRQLVEENRTAHRRGKTATERYVSVKGRRRRNRKTSRRRNR